MSKLHAMDGFQVEIINGRDEVVALRIEPEPVRITTRQIGQLLANAGGDDQAELLFQWAEAVDAWPLEAAMAGRSPGVWAVQCRTIAESLADDQCRRISLLLGTLVEHLDAVPRERSVGKQVDEICTGVAHMLETESAACSMCGCKVHPSSRICGECACEDDGL